MSESAPVEPPIAIGVSRKKEEKFLKPLRNKIRIRKNAVFDFETKDDDTQVMGWTRPFMLGFDDGEDFVCFRNDDAVMNEPWRLRHNLRGGLVDQFMRFLVNAGSKYQSKYFQLFAHNGGNFDAMFILGFLLMHQDEFEWEIAAVQSRIQRLEFWKRGQPKKAGHWVILDSLALLPMPLKKVGETFTPGEAEKMKMDLDLPEWTTGLSVQGASAFYGMRRSEAAKLFSDQGVTVIGLLREDASSVKPKAPNAMRPCPHRDSVFLYPNPDAVIGVSDEALVADPCPHCKAEADEESMLPLDGIGVLALGDTILVEGRNLDIAVRLAWSNTESFDVWETYNALDCRVLRLGLGKFHDLVENTLHGEVGITAPATAMKLYRRRYQYEYIHRNAHFKECNGSCRRGLRSTVERGVKKGMSLAACGRFGCDETCHGCAHDWVREGYVGGRTELHCEWGFDLRYYDRNSSYPASMLEDMPVGRMIVPKSTRLDVLSEMSKDHIGFVECDVYIPETCLLPPLPYKVPKGKKIVIKRLDGGEHVVPEGKLIFPTGHLSGTWSWEELKLLQHKLVGGSITRVHKSVWYEKAPVFREMVNDLYLYRQKHIGGCKKIDTRINEKGKKEEVYACGTKCCNPKYSEGLSFCAKLMLNSLYGKFGMREERTGLLFVPEGSMWPTDAWPIDGEHETCRVWEAEKLAHASYIIPQISAYITSLSRISLYHAMADIMMHGVCSNVDCRKRVELTPRVLFGRQAHQLCDACGSRITRGKLYYCDTDSVIANIDLSEFMLDDNILGMWKREKADILLSGSFRLPKLYQLGSHEQTCTNWHCKGCKAYFHQPSCKSKKCKGCATTQQRMKGVGSMAQTPEVYDAMLSGKIIRAERVGKHRSQLKYAMTGDERGFTVSAHKRGPKAPDRFFHDRGDDHEDDGRVKKSLRTIYDKRVLVGGGDTISIHIATL